ncbi:MAG: AlpA family phage regulatory protein [Aquincola sp.]|nr:AlpA family phage regulatory protein [Aquincola sp.]|tara:strand:+ start:982 stop:1356 length:375 start_codon:yes stop_codon:yes gene_type:complete
MSQHSAPITAVTKLEQASAASGVARFARKRSTKDSDQGRRRQEEALAAQLAAYAYDDALLGLPAVKALTGISGDSTVTKLVEGKRFPAPIRLSHRCSRWRAGDIRAWLAAHARTARSQAEGASL